MTHAPRPSFQGFTLIELLVVIGVIALLAALLVPVIGMVRESANKTVCAANMRSLTMGLLAYAKDDSSQRLPAGDYQYHNNMLGMGGMFLETLDIDPAAMDYYNFSALGKKARGLFGCPSAIKQKDQDFAFTIGNWMGGATSVINMKYMYYGGSGWYIQWGGAPGASSGAIELNTNGWSWNGWQYYSIPSAVKAGALYPLGKATLEDKTKPGPMARLYGRGQNAALFTDFMWIDVAGSQGPTRFMSWWADAAVPAHRNKNTNVVIGGNASFSDGHVEWIPKDRIAVRLEATWDRNYPLACY